MTNVNKVFRLAFSIILFCVGTGLLFYHSQVYSETLLLIREAYHDREVLRIDDCPDQEVVSYSQIISALCNEVEYDLLINDITIKQGNFNPECIKSYHIRQGTYSKCYRYDDNGEISTIIYSLITG